MHDFEELEPTTQAAMLRHFAREVLASYPVPHKGAPDPNGGPVFQYRASGHEQMTASTVRYGSDLKNAFTSKALRRSRWRGCDRWPQTGIVAPPAGDCHSRWARRCPPSERRPGWGSSVRAVRLVAGTPLREGVNGARAEELGRMAALLHEHASSTRPDPRTFGPYR